MEVLINKSELMVIRMPANESLANAIRRSVSEIQTIAIDEVEFFKNDSALYDEILAHRLGLVPLKTEKSMSDKTKFELKLSKVGPCTVYSGDLEGNVDVVEGKIPLTILGKEQKLELLATAKLGNGTEHAKHIPGLCYYRHLLEIKSSPQIDDVIHKSKGLIKPEKKGSKWICDISEGDIVQIEEIEPSAISDSDEIIFFVESYGSMSSKDILVKAIEVLVDNVKGFEKALK